MTKKELEKKLKHLKKEILYFQKVFPNSEKVGVLKSAYRHFNKMSKKINL